MVGLGGLGLLNCKIWQIRFCFQYFGWIKSFVSHHKQSRFLKFSRRHFSLKLRNQRRQVSAMSATIRKEDGRVKRPCILLLKVRCPQFTTLTHTDTYLRKQGALSRGDMKRRNKRRSNNPAQPRPNAAGLWLGLS